MAKRFDKSTEVQSLLFDKNKWSVTAARKWLRDHGHATPKAESSGDYHRFRQRPPFQFRKSTFRTIVFGRASNGIKAVIAVPRSSSSGSSKTNPRKTPATKRKPRIPALLVDLADARAIELEDGRELQFKLSGKFAMCANKKGDELWILSRKGGRRVATADQKAEKLFEKFTGFEAADTGALVRTTGKPLVRVGRALSIIYRSDKFSARKNDYIHTFSRYPTVSVDSITRPRIVALRGGRIRVTAEGITG